MWPGFHVYIVSSGRNGTLYIGMTDDLVRRISEHKARLIPGFTTRYGCNQLVWHESHPNRESAKARERALKEWRRSWKIELIEQANPTWTDLFPALSP